MVNASIELAAASSGAHSVTLQLLDAVGAVLLQVVHEFIVFPMFSVRALPQPLAVPPAGAAVAVVFHDPVYLDMSMRAEVVCSGGGVTATATHVNFMASAVDIIVPWRPFMGSNNSCIVRVRAMARQHVSLREVTFSASMADALAAVAQPLQFTVGRPSAFPVYLPSSFNGAEPAACAGDAVASVDCSTRGLDAAMSARYVDVTVTCQAVASAVVTVSVPLSSVSFDVLCLRPFALDRSVLHVRVAHIASVRAAVMPPCSLGIDCPDGWTCTVQDATATIVPPLSADAVTVITLMSIGVSSCMNNASVTVHAHPLAVFAQPLLRLPPSPDERGGLVASGRLYGPISSLLQSPLLYSSAPRLMTFCNLSVDPMRMAFSVTLLRSDVSQAALPCALPQPDLSLSASGCISATSLCVSVALDFPCDECRFAPGPFAPAPSAAAVQLTQAVALVSGNSLYVGAVSQLLRQSSISLSLSLVLPTLEPVSVSFSSGTCADVLPKTIAFAGVQAVAEMQVTWLRSGVCHITASSSAFAPLNFTVINAVPPVLMSPAVVRANMWQRSVIITITAPSHLLTSTTSIQVSASSQTVGAFPSESFAVDARCSCARVPFAITSPGSTQVRAVFVEGPTDLIGFQQVTSAAALTVRDVVLFLT